MVGDPRFARPGGLDATDYVPTAVSLVKDKGIKIHTLPGDEVGLKMGLAVKEDYFGNAITGVPDLGAVEIGGKP